MKKTILLAGAVFFSLAFGLMTVGFTYFNAPTEGSQVVETLTTAQNKTVQTKLKRWGYYTGAIDGICKIFPKKKWTCC